MKLSLEDLRAYVDGELSEEQKVKVAAFIENDEKLASQTAAMEASKLPYKAAYVDQGLPPVPPELLAFVKGWETISAGQPVTQSTRWSWQMAAAIALSVCLGFFVGYLSPRTDDSFAAQSTLKPEEANWVQLVADYQSLYVPATVAGGANPMQPAKELFSRLNVFSENENPVPDFSSVGYQFKRAQQLGYEGRPLLQLVYQNDAQQLLAFCLMPDPVEARPPSIAMINSQATISWRRLGHRFIIVAQQRNVDLEQIRVLAESTYL
ncbi:MAG: anti-sigma factor family protein [Granulosicoccaceae bacterium]